MATGKNAIKFDISVSPLAGRLRAKLGRGSLLLDQALHVVQVAEASHGDAAIQLKQSLVSFIRPLGQPELWQMFACIHDPTKAVIDVSPDNGGGPPVLRHATALDVLFVLMTPLSAMQPLFPATRARSQQCPVPGAGVCPPSLNPLAVSAGCHDTQLRRTIQSKAAAPVAPSRR